MAGSELHPLVNDASGPGIVSVNSYWRVEKWQLQNVSNIL